MMRIKVGFKSVYKAIKTGHNTAARTGDRHGTRGRGVSMRCLTHLIVLIIIVIPSQTLVCCDSECARYLSSQVSLTDAAFCVDKTSHEMRGKRLTLPPTLTSGAFSIDNRLRRHCGGQRVVR